jgi:small subunit ribosomal protein S5
MTQPKGRRKFKSKREKPEFDQQIVDLARVTRVTKGGKQLNFRACVVIGDRKGKVGYGVEKGSDVQIAVEKAVKQAKKKMLTIPLVNDTIPHFVQTKYKSGKVLIKPAPRGTGIIAGSSIRTVLDLAGVPNASAKMVGRSNNKIINVKTVFKALGSFLPSAVALSKERALREQTKAKTVQKIKPVEEIKNNSDEVKVESKQKKEKDVKKVALKEKTTETLKETKK